jgi:hypothetical protein
MLALQRRRRRGGRDVLASGRVRQRRRIILVLTGFIIRLRT